MVVQACHQPQPCDTLVKMLKNMDKDLIYVLRHLTNVLRHLIDVSRYLANVLSHLSWDIIWGIDEAIWKKLGTKSSSEDVSTSKNYIFDPLHFWPLHQVCEDYLYPPMDWSCKPGLAVALVCAILAVTPLVQVIHISTWPWLILPIVFNAILKINFINSDFILCRCFGGQYTSWGLSLHPLLILEKTINVIHTSLKSLRLDWNIETNQTIPLQKSNSKIHVCIFIQR